MDTIYFALLGPALCWLTACVCAGVWFARSKHSNLLVVAFALLLASLVQLHYLLTQDSASTSVSYIGWALASWISATAITHAIAQSVGARLQRRWLIGSAVWISLGTLYAVVTDASAHALAIVVAWGIAINMAHILPMVWHTAFRNRAELMLRQVYSAIIIVIVVSPWLLGSERYGLWFAVLLLPLCACLLTASMVVSIWDISRPKLRGSQVNDEISGVLSYAGLRAACGKLPKVQKITVLVLCDLDHFPKVRERWGPTASTAILQNFSHLLRRMIREADLVARVSDGSFVMALRGIDVTSTEIVLQRIQGAMSEPNWAHPSVPGPITVSFGVTVMRDNDSLDMALHRAEVLLFLGNDRGANRIELEMVLNMAAPS